MAIKVATGTRFLTATSASPSGSSVCNMSSSVCRSAADDRATSYNGAATINPAGIIAAASTILVVGITIAAAAIVGTAYDRPASNDRSTSVGNASPVDCGASMN